MKVKFALAAVSLILAVSLIANAYFYMQQSSFTARNDALRKQAAELRDEVDALQNETASLQNQLSQLDQEEGPKLVTRLGANDMRFTYQGQDFRLYVSGEVWNVGTSAAHNCRLHVTLYVGTVVAKEAYFELGTINAGSFVDVASNVYYAYPNALTNWTIVPEYG